jgi:outer membrane protein OmpA-like peptidoglycan-associated protein
VIQIRQSFAPTALVFWALLAVPLQAAPDLVLDFPGKAEQTRLSTQAMKSFQIATGPFEDDHMPNLQAEGTVRQVAWRVAMDRPSTLQIMQGLRQQVVVAGFKIIYDCESESCGGFDFRFDINVLPEPDMHVDLGDFRYLAAQRQGPSGPEYLSLLVSRSPQSGFVQLTQVGGLPPVSASAKPQEPLDVSTAMVTLPAISTESSAGQVTADLAQRLDAGLPVVLEDLEFPSGSGSLEADDYASLSALADWLKAHPQASVMLVGHTDASGGMAPNVALSKQRAASVREMLLQRFALPAAQVTSDGVGPLAPRSDDLSPEGRSKNRRVEVIVTPTQ